MVRSLASRVVFVGILCFGVAAIACHQPTYGADADHGKKEAKKSHRLPPYYKDVVTQEQRDKIYKIQDDFNPKIDALEAQLKKAKKEQTDKIEALLTPEQKKKIEAAEAKAKEEQAKKKADKKKAEKKDAAKADAAAVVPPAKAKPAK